MTGFCGFVQPSLGWVGSRSPAKLVMLAGRTLVNRRHHTSQVEQPLFLERNVDVCGSRGLRRLTGGATPEFFFLGDRGQPEKNPNCVLEDMREHQQRLAVRRLTVQFLSHKTSSRSSWIIHLASTMSCSPTRVQRAFRNGVCEHFTQSMGCPERLHKPSVSRERPEALTMLHVFQKVSQQQNCACPKPYAAC